MSVKAMSWAWEQRTGDPTRKAILVTLADHADGDGVCWPGHVSIADRCEVSRRTVIRHIAELEAAGFIDVEQRRGSAGRQTSNLYRLKMGQGDNLTPRQGDAGDTPGVSPVTPQGDTGDGGPVSPVSRSSNEPPLEPPRNPQTNSIVFLVDEIPVGDDEHELARSLLSVFNTESGSMYPLDAQIEKIVRQIRRHRELEPKDHVEIVAGALTEQWWSGSASPSIVWGKSDLFDAHVENWRAGITAKSNTRFSAYDEGTVKA